MFQVRNLFLLLLLPIAAYALPSDMSKTMSINADATTFNFKSGINLYEGNVKIDQGETHLLADKVITEANAQHKIQMITAYGTTKRVEYSTLPKTGDTLIHAQADTIKFYTLKSLVVLEGNVTVTQGKDTFHGPTIYYNIKDQTVSAPPSKQGRTTIIIEPSKLQS